MRIEELERLVDLGSLSQVIAFRQKMALIEKDPGLPYQDYFAFNFDDERVLNLKLYFSFFKKPERGILDEILPTLSDIEPFLGFYPDGQSRNINNTGFSLAIKVNSLGEATTQVHFRFPFNSSLCGPKNVVLSRHDLMYSQGISFEYKASETLRKDYYYLAASPGFLNVLRDFKDPNFGQLVEYTETEKFTKVIHWFRQLSHIQSYLENKLSKSQLRFIRTVEALTGTVAMFPGVYAGQRQRSMYFFNVPRSEQILQNFLGSQQIETLPAFDSLKSNWINAKSIFATADSVADQVSPI